MWKKLFIIVGCALAASAQGRDVFLLGDSIRQGYGPYVKEMLEARGDRVFQPTDNCRFAQYTLRSLVDWVKLAPDPAKVEVVHWNNGLWDIGEIPPGEYTTPVEIYTNFVVRTAKALRHLFPNAKLVFATTTPINESVKSYWHTHGNEPVETYNAAAKTALAGVVDGIDDLNAFVKVNGIDRQYKDIVHFKPEGSKRLAEQVIRSIDAATAVAANPLFPGWYADPQIRRYGDTYWVFPTYSQAFKEQLFLDLFSSKDLKTWTKHPRALDAKDVPWVKGALWAPDAHEKDGKYYIFFGANDAYPIDRRGGNFTPVTEPGIGKYGGIGVAVADRPEGPYRDLIGKPLIDQFWNAAQPIDQFVFTYKGDWYMVYGGWERCNLVKLAPDFKSLLPLDDGKMWRDITPEHYTEGPVMFERMGKWYFMYSTGGWTTDNYRVNYSVADTPFGPFTFKGGVLSTQRPVSTGAGHHSVINIPCTDDWYICYHRHPIPNQGGNDRVTCLDRMYFDKDGNILPIIQTPAK